MSLGSSAMQLKEFAAYKPRTVVGPSITVIAPTELYDPARLINLSSLGWAFKPEIGVSKPVGRWTLEVAGGAWLFTAIHDFFGGVLRNRNRCSQFKATDLHTSAPNVDLRQPGAEESSVYQILDH